VQGKAGKTPGAGVRYVFAVYLWLELVFEDIEENEEYNYYP
jgi:hypothetical protein